MEKVEGTSLDLTKTNIDKLKELFPNIVTDGKIDFDVLRTMLGDEVDDSKEKYQFTWKGKSDAIKLAQSPSSATLRPDKESSKNWDTTENLYIEGDNLEVLKQLQKTYYGKIKMIYIDPPYNTGNDFVYKDNYKESIKNYHEQTNQTNQSNPETSGSYHTKWLNMIYPRLLLAKNLLADDGVVFISIDDNEIANLTKIVEDIFGENNILASFPRITKKAGKTTEAIAKNHDYLVLVSKTSSPKFFLAYHDDDGYKHEDEYVTTRGKFKLNQTLDYDSLSYSSSLDYPIKIEGKTFYPGQSEEKYLERKAGKHGRADWAWRWSKELFEFGYNNGFIVIKHYDNYSRIYTKTYQNARIIKSEKGFLIDNIKRTKAISSIEFVDNMFSNDNSKKDLLKVFDTSVFDYSKPISLIKTLISYTVSKGDIVLDFFSGSATTAHAVMKLNAEDGGNRKFIMVQLPEVCDEKSEAYKAGYKNICEIGEERIRRAGEMIKSEWEREHPQDSLLSDDDKFTTDIGFKVFKLDSTNIRPWDNENELSEEIVLELENIFKEDRSKEDILYEIMLKYGVFDMPVSEVEVNGKTMYRVGKRYMIVCLEDKITSEDVREIAELRPKTVIFKESGFSNDNDKINAEYNLNKAGVEDVKCI